MPLVRSVRVTGQKVGWFGLRGISTQLPFMLAWFRLAVAHHGGAGLVLSSVLCLALA